MFSTKKSTSEKLERERMKNVLKFEANYCASLPFPLCITQKLSIFLKKLACVQCIEELNAKQARHISKIDHMSVLYFVQCTDESLAYKKIHELCTIRPFGKGRRLE